MAQRGLPWEAGGKGGSQGLTGGGSRFDDQRKDGTRKLTHAARGVAVFGHENAQRLLRRQPGQGGILASGR